MNSLRVLMTAFILNHIGYACSAARDETAPAQHAASPLIRPAGGDMAAAMPETLGGIVTDQTTSVAGQEFYKHFSALWSDRTPLDFFSIAVCERPSARRGKRVVVEYAQRTLFESHLPTSRAGIQQVSENAVHIAYDSMANMAVQRLLFKEQDLAADEL